MLQFRSDGIEVLHAQLAPQATQRWYQQATSLQMSLGATRDVTQASVLLVKLDVEPGLAEFLRGLALGQATPISHHTDRHKGRATPRLLF